MIMNRLQFHLGLSGFDKFKQVKVVRLIYKRYRV